MFFWFIGMFKSMQQDNEHIIADNKLLQWQAMRQYCGLKVAPTYSWPADYRQIDWNRWPNIVLLRLSRFPIQYHQYNLVFLHEYLYHSCAYLGLGDYICVEIIDATITTTTATYAHKHEQWEIEKNGVYGCVRHSSKMNRITWCADSGSVNFPIFDITNLPIIPNFNESTDFYYFQIQID